MPDAVRCAGVGADPSCTLEPKAVGHSDTRASLNSCSPAHVPDDLGENGVESTFVQRCRDLALWHRWKQVFADVVRDAFGTSPCRCLGHLRMRWRYHARRDRPGQHDGPPARVESTSPWDCGDQAIFSHLAPFRDERALPTHALHWATHEISCSPLRPRHGCARAVVQRYAAPPLGGRPERGTPRIAQPPACGLIGIGQGDRTTHRRRVRPRPPGLGSSRRGATTPRWPANMPPPANPRGLRDGQRQALATYRRGTSTGQGRLGRPRRHSALGRTSVERRDQAQRWRRRLPAEADILPLAACVIRSGRYRQQPAPRNARLIVGRRA